MYKVEKGEKKENWNFFKDFIWVLKRVEYFALSTISK